MTPEDTVPVLGFFGGGLRIFRESVSQLSTMRSKTLYVSLSTPSRQCDSIKFLSQLGDLQQSLRVGLPLTLHPTPPTHIHKGILKQRLTVIEGGEPAEVN